MLNLHLYAVNICLLRPSNASCLFCNKCMWFSKSSQLCATKYEHVGITEHNSHKTIKWVSDCLIQSKSRGFSLQSTSHLLTNYQDIQFKYKDGKDLLKSLKIIIFCLVKNARLSLHGLWDRSGFKTDLSKCSKVFH